MSTGIAMARPAARRPSRPRTAKDVWPLIIVVALVVIPAAFVPLKAAGGGPSLNIPIQHFIIVSAVSLLAALVAAILAVTTVQIGVYRVLFVCLGFMTMGAIFTVHGLTTPGVVIAMSDEYRGSAAGLSAFLSVFAPALFFAAAYAPGLSRLERHMPFWPAGWLVVLTILSLGFYGGIALLNAEVLAESSLSVPPISTGLVVTAAGLFMYAAIRQGRLYRVAQLSSQADLIFSFVLLADATAAMILFPAWTLGWWSYHLLMLASVTFAVRALVVERAMGRPFRSIVESTLELGVDVETEEFDVEAVASLVAAVEVKDHETRGHNHRVAELCVRIGHELGMPAKDLRVLARCGLLHDVGKLAIPDKILRKPGPLTEGEWAVMKTHPEIGLRIVNRAGPFKRELLGVLHHHERMDGSGYPHGLAGDAIPVEARIVAVADTFDVLTSDRPYRKARSAKEARAVVIEESGSHLDSEVVAALLRTLDEDGVAAADSARSRLPSRAHVLVSATK